MANLPMDTQHQLQPAQAFSLKTPRSQCQWSGGLLHALVVGGLSSTLGLSGMALLGIGSGVAIAPQPAQANGCFMVDSAGRTVNLGKLCGESTSSPGKASNARVIRAPIKRRSGGTPVIEVTFNGMKKFDMIVDTGASATLVTRQMADALQLKPIGKFRAQIADGSTVEFPTGRLQSLGVQGAVAKNVEVAIAEKMSLGLLGHDFFGNYDVKILEKYVEFHRR